jgi:hypothetical protein
MRSRTLAGLTVFVVPFAAAAHAQVACKLLQPAEVESALQEWAAGGKAREFSGGPSDSGGVSMDACSSDIVRSHGSLVVTVIVVKNFPMDGGEAIRTRNAALGREGQWKTQGAQFEQKTVGTALCTRSGRPNVAAHSVCAIARGKGYVEVDVRSPTQQDLASMEAVGALVQKANGRL